MILGDLALPAVAVRQQPLLVVVKLLAGFGGEFEIRPLDDGVDRTGLLAQPAIDAFDHVDVVARGAARAVVAPRAGLDGDRLRRTDRLAQLAGDAALFAVRIAAQRVLAAKARRQRTLLERIIERRLRLEEIAHRQHEGLREFLEEQRTGGLIEFHVNLSCRPLTADGVADPIADVARMAMSTAENQPAHRPTACPRTRRAVRASADRFARAAAARRCGSPARRWRPQRSFRRDAPSQAGSENSMPSSLHFGAHPVTCSTPATIATMASEIGRNTFQPSRIN